MNDILSRVGRNVRRLSASIYHRAQRIMWAVVSPLVYALVIAPIGSARQLLGGDPLMLRHWKEAPSLFNRRDHTFTAADLERMF